MTYLRRFANTEQFKVENKIITVCSKSKIFELVLQPLLTVYFCIVKTLFTNYKFKVYPDFTIIKYIQYDCLLFVLKTTE